MCCKGQCYGGKVAIASATQTGGVFSCSDDLKLLCYETKAKELDCQ